MKELASVALIVLLTIGFGKLVDRPTPVSMDTLGNVAKRYYNSGIVVLDDAPSYRPRAVRQSLYFLPGVDTDEDT
jgi:hypothetical protein